VVAQVEIWNILHTVTERMHSTARSIQFDVDGQFPYQLATNSTVVLSSQHRHHGRKFPCKTLKCVGNVNNVHCAEIVYLPTINWLSIAKCVILYFLYQHHLDLRGGDQRRYEIKGLMHSGATFTSCR